jgi:hypothetical protein
MVVARKRSSTWLRPELSGSRSRTSISVPTGISSETAAAADAGGVARARAHVVDPVAQIHALRPRHLLLLAQLDGKVGHLVGQIVELLRQRRRQLLVAGPRAVDVGAGVGDGGSQPLDVGVSER